MRWPSCTGWAIGSGRRPSSAAWDPHRFPARFAGWTSVAGLYLRSAHANRRSRGRSSSGRAPLPRPPRAVPRAPGQDLVARRPDDLPTPRGLRTFPQGSGAGLLQPGRTAGAGPGAEAVSPVRLLAGRPPLRPPRRHLAGSDRQHRAARHGLETGPDPAECRAHLLPGGHFMAIDASDLIIHRIGEQLAVNAGRVA